MRFISLFLSTKKTLIFLKILLVFCKKKLYKTRVFKDIILRMRQSGALFSLKGFVGSPKNVFFITFRGRGANLFDGIVAEFS